MNIYQKLQEARCRFQAANIKKSGHNKFSDYDYFELGDFMPTINEIMRDLGMTAITSFGAELAAMTIVNSDQPEEQIVITSPMSKASLKACHEVQNLGAVETYIRRYLWQAALEIVEHDAVDRGDNKPGETKGSSKAPQNAQPQEASSAPVTPDDLKKLYALAAQKGYADNVVKSQIKKKFGVSPDAIPRDAYMELYKSYYALPDAPKDQAS